MKRTFLVLGATGRTGRHFVALVLKEGHTVRALVRDPTKVPRESPLLEVVQGSTSDDLAWEDLLHGVDCVVLMLGDAALQRQSKINTRFVKKLVPAMRSHGVQQLLYQAGGLTRPYKQRLPLTSWIIRNTLARANGLLGQHEDNEAVIEYLVEEAQDIRWVVHRASLYSDGPSRGRLERSSTRLSIATFVDCAAYSYRLVSDDTAVHTSDVSCYAKPR